MAESESDLAKAVNDPGDREISLSNSDQSETNPPGEGQNSIIVKAKKEKTLTRSVSFSSYTKVREIKNKAVGSQRDEEAGEQLHQEKMGKNVFEGVITETEIVKPMKVSKKGERNRSEERWAEKTSKAVKKKGEMIEVTSKTAVRKNGQNDEKGKRKTGKKKKRDKKEPARSKVRKPTRRDNSKLGSPLSPSSGPTITSSKVSMWTKQTADHDLKPASERHLSGRHSAGMLQLGAESSEETWECTPSALIPEELLPPVDLFPKSDDSSDSADDEEEYVECRPSTAPTLASAGSNRAQQLLQASQTSSKPLSALPTGRLPSLESAPAAQDSAEREVKDDQEDDKKPVTLKGVVGKMKLNFKAFGTSQDSQKVLPVVHGLTNSSEHEYDAAVDGIHRFGISKMGLARAVVKFCSGSPDKQGFPLTLCFQFPSGYLTHRYVLDMVRIKLQKLEGRGKVTSIQYVDRNVIHGTRGLDHRWLVALNSVEARDELLNRGLHLFSRRVALRPYDDILKAEYREYQQYIDLKKAMFRITGGSRTDNGKSRAQLVRTPSMKEAGAPKSKDSETANGEERPTKGGSGRKERDASSGKPDSRISVKTKY